MMFVMIFEDGQVYKMETLGDGEYSAADDGYLDIIDISGDVPMRYTQGTWTEIEDAPIYSDNKESAG